MSADVSSHSQDCKNLNEWLSYLETIHSSEIDLGLARIGIVAERLAIDFSFAKVITVAGTNGKGTTCAFLENALLSEPVANTTLSKRNLSVAVYSSPHIERFNERLRVNKQDVADQAFINAFELIEQTRAEISLSYYEYTTLAALLILMKVKPDVIILEVGLGGRLDATNIIDADIAVITTIDIDHQAFLGNTREKIGFEKAGIMRADQDIIIGDVNCPQSVINHAINVNDCVADTNRAAALAKIQLRNRNFIVAEQTDDESEQPRWQWQYSTNSSNQTFSLNNLIEPHIPRDNVATALMVLQRFGIELTENKVNHYISQTKVAGRTEMFTRQCDIMLDVGHNPHAGRYLAKQLTSLKKQKNYTKVIAITAMLVDKDITNTLAPLAAVIDQWYIAPLDVPRAATIEFMQESLSDFTNSINCFDNVTQAFKIANQEVKPTELILVFGSFYTVAEIRKQLI